MLEIKKLIPALLTNYEVRNQLIQVCSQILKLPQFHLVDPLRYKIHNAWMVRQWGLDVTMTRRENQQEKVQKYHFYHL